MARDILREFSVALQDRALDPAVQADRTLYVDDLHPQADGCDLIVQLADQIDWDEGGGTYLFTGPTGSGKTTELHRLRKVLADRGMDVFFVDLGQHLHLDSPVAITDFLLAVMEGFGDDVRATKGANVLTRNYFERLAGFLQTDVKIEEIGVSANVADVKLALRQDPDFKQRLQERSRNHVSRLVAEAREFVRDTLRAVEGANSGAKRKTILIVDSAEKIRGLGDQATTVYRSVHDLFARHAENLRFTGLHVVYTVPQYLMALGGNIASLYSSGTVYALASVHLFARRSRAPETAGLERMVEVVARRFPEWEQVFQASLLKDIALRSGGDIRDYFRMLRLCLGKASQKRVGQETPRVTEEIKNGAIAMARRDMLPIADKDLVWLRRIASTHDPSLPEVADLVTFARFCDGKTVLNYRNGDDWFDVHPLIWDNVGSA